MWLAYFAWQPLQQFNLEVHSYKNNLFVEKSIGQGPFLSFDFELASFFPRIREGIMQVSGFPPRLELLHHQLFTSPSVNVGADMCYLPTAKPSTGCWLD